MALVAVKRSPNSMADSSPQATDGEAEDEENSKTEKSSECRFAGKGAELVLSLKDAPQYAERRLSTDSIKSTNSTQSNNSDIQLHLQSMFSLLRHEETLKMAVKLESQRPNRTRYLVIASRSSNRSLFNDRKHKVTRHNSVKVTASTGHILNTSISSSRQMSSEITPNRPQQMSQTEYSDNVELREKRISMASNNSNRLSLKTEFDKISTLCDNKCLKDIEESCLLGIDCNENTTIGLVLPILADTTIHLDGDGGFSISVFGKTHIFKPVSVQAMWSALQTLHKVSQKARENNFYPGGPSHDWLTFYETNVESDQSCLNEWNAMDSLESKRPPSPDAIRNKPTAKEETKTVIKMKLKEIMMSVDLDEVTSKYIRGRLEEHLDKDLGEYKSFIDEEMLMILGQMDAPTMIFDHVYLGSEWNASNLEELQKNGVRHILNVTREIDNFFPGMFNYFNVRVYDDEKTNLLKHWDNTYRYITRAKSEGSKVLVHCKMGVSRSASVVIAYAMKAYNWEFEKALQHVKGRRNCIKPNKNFLNQLETYSGMLDAMKNKEKLQRSKSETNLKSTKDARLLPGSEPTPLIQALNHSKSKSTGQGVCDFERSLIFNKVRQTREQKYRKLFRRSSSTSPKSIDNSAIVIKQQSQSLENLTPDRSTTDEPKNVRYPGSNGENYSVTQNQVLHIQKNTPILPFSASNTSTSVRTIVHDLEASHDARKFDDRKYGRSVSHDAGVKCENIKYDEKLLPFIGGVGLKLSSPVWTSSAKLITQTSNLHTSNETDVDFDTILFSNLRCSSRSRPDTIESSCDTSDIFIDNVFKEEKSHNRKTQSWAASNNSGCVIIDAAPYTIGCDFLVNSKVGSNSSIDSSSSNNTNATSMTYEGNIRQGFRHRELPSRHASWGSGDNRCGIPMRNSSWGSYDTNRNTLMGSTTATAIFEGQVQDLNMSNKTAIICLVNENQTDVHNVGSVKRTKQKLEESCTIQKLCQEKGNCESKTISLINSNESSSLKKSSNLFRSVSAAGYSRARFPNRCNSEEIVPSSTMVMSQRNMVRRSEGSRPINEDLISTITSDTYTLSDIENKNTLPLNQREENEKEEPEDQKIAGNVKILKKNFEAKASTVCCPQQTQQQITSLGTKLGHQSLPSSPVAQHINHSAVALTTTVPIASTTSIPATLPNTSFPSSFSTICCMSQPCDRNVKGLVHKYQKSNLVTVSVPTTNSMTISTNIKPRPRSYYDNVNQKKSVTGKPLEYNEGRPPPVPAKIIFNSTDAGAQSQVSNVSESITIQQQQRRLQQHGKTHPLARLSLPKQSLNAAAYNTM